MIYLNSKPQRVKEILKPTKAEFFRDLVEGSTIQLSLPVKPPGRGRTLYATYVTVTNVTTGAKTQSSLTQLSVLNNFEFEELS